MPHNTLESEVPRAQTDPHLGGGEGHNIMKSQKIKNKALELYIGNVPIYKISKQLHIDKTTVIKWRKANNWEEIKEEAIQKTIKKTTNELINVQTELARLSSEELLELLKNKELKPSELVSLAKHGLEVVRPKTVQNNLNITKNENTNTSYQIIIPKEVEELLEAESGNIRIN